MTIIQLIHKSDESTFRQLKISHYALPFEAEPTLSGANVFEMTRLYHCLPYICPSTMQRITFLLLFLFAADCASAQSFSIFNIDLSGFPTMKAQFYAFDANGTQQSPQPSEITINEEGVLRTALTVTCPPPATPPPVTLGVMIDTYAKIDLAKYGTTKLINQLSIPPSEAGITMMDGGAPLIVQDITQKKQRLFDATSKLMGGASVDIQTMFYAPNSGGVNFVNGRPNKKILVLISDLHCPHYDLNKAQLLSDCFNQNISVYVVLLGTNDAQNYFRPITEQTKGKLFENIYSRSDLDKVMLLIDAQEGGYTPCQMTWKSGASCQDSLLRQGIAIWNGASSAFNYSLTINEIFNVNPPFVLFPGKPVGKKFDTTITITSGTAFTVTDISSSDPSYDINPKSFSLAAGETKTLTLSYTPLDSSYTWTVFTISTDQCSRLFSASGGFPGIKPKRTLQLVSPNGGEVYLEGSDTLITWKGIPLSDNVNLQLSTDAGKSWSLITNSASGGLYHWHVPSVVSNQCLVSVNQDAPPQFSPWPVVITKATNSWGHAITGGFDGNIYVAGNFQNNIRFDASHAFTSPDENDVFIAKYHPDASVEWAIKAGGFGYNFANAIETDFAGNIYVAGFFSGTVNFGTKSLTSFGNYDIFLAKYDPSGAVVWVSQAGGIGDDESSKHIAVDQTGNIYLSGYYNGAAKFDTANLPNDGQSVFLAKYKSDGKLEWIKHWPAGFSSYDERGFSVRIGPSGNIYLASGFIYTTTIDGKSFTSALNPSCNCGTVDILLLKFRPDGSLVWGKDFGGDGADVPYSMAIDSSEHIYLAGNYDGTPDFGGVKLPPNSGATSFFTAKYDSSGGLLWVRSAVGAKRGGFGTWVYNFTNCITSDPKGNITICGGSGSDSLYFDTLGFKTIYGRGENFDILVFSYNSDGVIQWVKSFGGSANDVGSGIAQDIGGNIYATGTIGYGQIDNKTYTQQDTTGLFIWKYGSNIFQSDTSDAVFSIIAPTFSFSATTIDMGKVETGKQKDSLVKATICNNGNMPMHILGMDVTGGATTEFMIMGGAGDFILQPGECRDVLFTFMPMMTGKMSASVTVRTTSGNYADTIKILGEGIAPELQVIGNVIDFGQVAIGYAKDTTITVAIKNIGAVPLDFTSNSQLGPDVKQFSLQSGATPFTLAPGASQTVTLRFSPKYIGRTSGRIAFDYTGVGSPAILNLFGQGLGGLVAIPDDSGYAGDHRSVPMILKNVFTSSVQSVATNFSARVAYDRTVLYSNNAIQGKQYDTVTINGSLNNSDTISFIPFLALLGDATTSPMNLVDFNWLDAAGNPADYDVETESGTFHLLGICPAGGNRLYDPNGQVTMAHITPNPSNGIIHIDIQTTETGRTQLAIMNLLGEQVASISDGELKPGAHSFDFNTVGLSAGSYFLLMQTPTVRRLERIEVEK